MGKVTFHEDADAEMNEAAQTDRTRVRLCELSPSLRLVIPVQT
jgi:hypothetical protein